MAQNTNIRERLTEIQSTADTEKEWWEKRKATIQSDFMRELDEEKKSPASDASGVKGSDEDGVLVEGGGPVDKSGKGKKKKGKN